MDKFAFTPFVDFPLASVSLAAFIWHFNQWALRGDIDSAVDIVSRLPGARIRVILLFGCLLLICWLLNFAFWSIFALLFGIGLVVAVILGGDIEGSTFGLWAAAYLIREWAFGFPQLILHPQHQDGQSSTRPEVTGPLAGKTGVTTSPLRPMGDADIEGVKHAVVSCNGDFLDAGLSITVTAYRNGYPCVTPSFEADKSGEERRLPPFLEKRK